MNENLSLNMRATIKAYRLSKKLKQVDVAKKSGLSQGTISKYESGQIDLTMGIFAKLLDGLDLEMRLRRKKSDE